MNNAYPTTAEATRTRTDKRVFKNAYGPFFRRANRGDLEAYAAQVMNEDILTLASRAREAHCYKKQCMHDPLIKGSQFALAVKVTLVAFNRRKDEYLAVMAANKAAS